MKSEDKPEVKVEVKEELKEDVKAEVKEEEEEEYEDEDDSLAGDIMAAMESDDEGEEEERDEADRKGLEYRSDGSCKLFNLGEDVPFPLLCIGDITLGVRAKQKVSSASGWREVLTLWFVRG